MFHDFIFTEVIYVKLKHTYKDVLATRKPEDAVLTAFIYRKISRPTLFLVSNFTNMTPNQLTVLSFLSSIAAGVLIIFGSRASFIAAAVCIQLAFILDNVDGEVARIKNLKSKFGGWFDGFTNGRFREIL